MYIFEKDKYFNECHAISVIQLFNGEYLATWFAGSEEGKADIDVWLAGTTGGNWNQPVKIVTDEEPLWNPVFLYEKDKLILFYRKGWSCSGWDTYYMVSTDQGHSFTDPEILPDGYLGPIKNKPIKMSNGKWLCGSSREPEWETVMEIYDADKNEWLGKSVIGVPDLETGHGIIQPTVWESQPGHVHGLMRSSLGKIYRSDSTDYGMTWSAPYSTELPNNNSGIDIVRMPGGELILANNPIGENFGKRSPLVLSMSMDNGKTWPCHYTLEEEEDFDPEDRYRGRYSYPAIINSQNGVTCFYTYNRKQIRYQTIPVEAIRNYQSRAVS